MLRQHALPKSTAIRSDRDVPTSKSRHVLRHNAAATAASAAPATTPTTAPASATSRDAFAESRVSVALREPIAGSSPTRYPPYRYSRKLLALRGNREDDHRQWSPGQTDGGLHILLRVAFTSRGLNCTNLTYFISNLVFDLDFVLRPFAKGIEDEQNCNQRQTYSAKYVSDCFYFGFCK